MPSPSLLPVTAGESRVAALRRLTRGSHERLDHAVMACGIFQDRQRFTRFVRMQYRFHVDIAPLHARADLAAHFPDLPARARLAHVASDLRDLGVQPDPYEGTPGLCHAALPEALGWLYVAEGSSLGAAILLKLAAPLGLHAGFGATHLAPAASGVASHWRAFTDALDRIVLPADAEAQVVEGANAAFASVHAHLRDVFA